MDKDEEDFEAMIGEYMNMWPSEIAVPEIFIEGKKSPFSELILAHDRIEIRLDYLKNNKLWVLDWSVYKHLGSLAKKQETILIADLDLNSIKRVYIADIRKWRDEFT